jgi:hypothetical protein
MHKGKFDLFVGVDWSGAKGPNLPGLKVAVCQPGAKAPALVPNPSGGHWTRPAFADWLSTQIDSGQRLLCGMDFSFCFPWVDQGAYRAGYPEEIDDWHQFWNVLADICAGEPGFYGGAFANHPDWQDHFANTGKVGQAYVRRLRVTEVACQQQGLGVPESVFNLRGARQVGKSSLAGMRVLHYIRSNTHGVAVWPFDTPTPAQSVLVETFPTAFVRMAGAGAGKIRDQGRLGEVLAYFGSEPGDIGQAITDDEADALVTSAALRQLSPQSHWWKPEGLSDRVRRYEGWTFGVR